MTFIRIFDMLILSGDRDQSRLSEIAPLEWGQYETLELFEFSRFFFLGGGMEPCPSLGVNICLE